MRREVDSKIGAVGELNGCDVLSVGAVAVENEFTVRKGKRGDFY